MSEKNINLVITGNFLYPKGMAGTKRIQHIVDVLSQAQGQSVTLLLLRQSHAGRDDNTLSGVHRGTPYTTIGHDVSAGWQLPIRLMAYLRDGFRHIRHVRDSEKRNILYVYGEMNIENLPFVLYARKLGYRIVFDIVEDYYYIGSNSHILSRFKHYTSRWMSRYMKHLADGIIVISAYLREKYETGFAGLVPVHLLPVSVDLQGHTSTKTAFGNPVRVLYAGSFGDKDSVENLIGAFEDVCRKHEGVELVLTGQGTSSRMDAIRTRIASSQYSGRIHYLGFLDDRDYYRLIADCDIPCMVRDASGYANAGFPFKLGEYLATGNPTIASDTGDVRQYLSDHQSAYIIEPGSATSIACALQYILEHPEEALRVGKAGKSVAEEHFEKYLVGNRLLQFLHAI